MFIECVSGAHSFTGHALNFCLIAFSEPPSEVTSLENIGVLIAFSESPSEITWLENVGDLIAFSEPPSEVTWLENA